MVKKTIEKWIEWVESFPEQGELGEPWYDVELEMSDDDFNSWEPARE